MKVALKTKAEIIEAVNAGKDVYCMGGSYKVVKDNKGQYLIECMSNKHCVGLSGQDGTQYENVLNARNFYTEVEEPTTEQPKTVGDIRQEREDKISELFKNCGVFFAFSNEQFAENKTPLKEGEKYVSMGAGGYLPKGKSDELLKGMKDIKKWFKEATKDKKTRIELIKFELANHEAYYTGELEDTLSALGEGFTIAEVREVYRSELKYQAL